MKLRPIEFFEKNGFLFQLIKPGRFTMGNELPPETIAAKFPGSDVELFRDAPAFEATLTKPFYLSRFATTIAQFRRFVKETDYITTAEDEGSSWGYDKGRWGDWNGLYWRKPGFRQTKTDPVVCVSRLDADAYLDWLNEEAEFDDELEFKPHYRLPTEAEWEYSCRAGSTSIYFWGNELKAGERFLNAADESGVPWGEDWRFPFPFAGEFATTAPVGSFQPNDWNLFDMSGNVWEWCDDWYGPYPNGATTDPRGPEKGIFRVFRGGGWDGEPHFCRSAARQYGAPDFRNADLGFRVLMEIGVD